MAWLFQTVISPRSHRRFDSVALAGLIGLTARMSRRSRPAASLVALTAAIEGVTFLTDFPPGFLPRMSLRDHIRVGLTAPVLVAAPAFLSRDVTPRERRLILALLAVPMVWNAPSDDRDNQLYSCDLSPL